MVHSTVKRDIFKATKIKNVSRNGKRIQMHEGKHDHHSYPEFENEMC